MKKYKYSEIYKSYVKTSAVGLEFGLSIVLCALLGYGCDNYFLSSPYGLIIGCIIGFLAGIKRLWIFSKEYIKKK